MSLKKILKLFSGLGLSVFLSFSLVIPVSAESVNSKIENAEMFDIEDYKYQIYESEGIMILDDDIIEFSEEGGVVTLSVQTTEGFDSYVFGLDNDNSLSSRSTIQGIIKKIWEGGKLTCAIIKIISGDNVCLKVGVALLQNMALNIQYRATSVLYKNPSCVPYYSQHCSSAAGGAYWKTSVTPV